jgi:3-(3-hydroxy-phenyl)propionate hydroxylase
MEKFRHGRLLFIGDAAHQVSPFGARGANSGIQDTDNLLWKVKLVLDGKAPDTLLDSYDEERVYAADENLLNSTRSTDFITPKSPVSNTFRNATLLLAEEYPFARTLVNSGRLSLPSVYHSSSLNTADEDEFDSNMVPGTPSTDAPVNESDWFLRVIGNNRFNGLFFAEQDGTISEANRNLLTTLANSDDIAINILIVGLTADQTLPNGMARLADNKGLLTERFDGKPGTFYLFRPDQHIAARWRALDQQKIAAALNRATGRS